MRALVWSLLVLTVCSCGVSTLEMNSGSVAELVRVEPDAGRADSGMVAVDAGQRIVEPDAGEPTFPEDAGAPEDAGWFPEDAGVPVVDAGIPRECENGTTTTCVTACGSGGTKVCSEERWGACRVPAESCDNGIDDDCDGRIDHRDTDCPTTVFTCESSEGGGCNGDLGYGDHCGAEDNTGGCSAARFNAWCNRRNPATPNIWDNWIRNWVDSRCDGALAETGTQYSTWYCVSSNNDEFRCTTPLVLSFDGAPVSFRAASDSRFAFTPGDAVRSDWPASVTPWLSRDVNRNGRIDDGRELFGADTRVGARTAKHGFEALAAIDENADGVIDARDPAFAELLLWRDTNGDRRSQPDELTTLSREVKSLSVKFSVEPRCDDRGNCERERSAFTAINGQSGTLVDVYVRIEPDVLSCR